MKVKLFALFFIYLLSANKILNTSVINSIPKSSTANENINDSKEKVDQVLKIVNEHKNYIFDQYRKVKYNFPDDLHNDFEKEIKEFEWRMLTSDDSLGDYILSKYSYLMHKIIMANVCNSI